MRFDWSIAKARCRRGCVWIALLWLCVGPSGCGSSPRPDLSMVDLLAERDAADKQATAEGHAVVARSIARLKGEYDQYAGGHGKDPPVLDLLIISGGGDWGAFGAGVLKGWGRVADNRLTRPCFDAVTGVSTGALIAPFAFLGDDKSIERVVTFYRHPQKNWAEKRGWLFFLPGNPSFLQIQGLEHEIREALDLPTLTRIAGAGGDGRLLLVNTTDVDFGCQRAWDVVDEARRAVKSDDPGRVQRILLASSAIPGAFPPRQIGGSLYVDGAITGNILYGGRAREDDTFPARWAAAYPDLPIPKVRYWVIFNNQFRFPPQITQRTWPAVVSRSQIMSTQTSTINSIRHLFAQAEIARLKRGADVEVRVIAVPDDFVPPAPGVFQKETMNALVDLGERMGADPSSWRMEPP